MKIKQGLYEDITANLDCDVTTMMTEVVIVSDGFPCFLAIGVKFQTLLPSHSYLELHMKIPDPQYSLLRVKSDKLASLKSQLPN